MERGLCGGTKAGDVAGVRRYLRFVKGYMQHLLILALTITSAKLVLHPMASFKHQYKVKAVSQRVLR